MKRFGTVALFTLALGAAAACEPPPGADDGLSLEQAALSTTNDLTVAYIQRLPTLSWVTDSTNPTRQGWPTAGQSVTWRGFIKNFSSSSRSNIQYKWYFDG